MDTVIIILNKCLENQEREGLWVQVSPTVPVAHSEVIWQKCLLEADGGEGTRHQGGCSQSHPISAHSDFLFIDSENADDFTPESHGKA